MNDIEHFLSDEFVLFSECVKALHEKKKTLQAEFKLIYDKLKTDLKAIDDEAKHAHAEFEDWKSSQKLKGETQPKTSK